MFGGKIIEVDCENLFIFKAIDNVAAGVDENGRKGAEEGEKYGNESNGEDVERLGRKKISSERVLNIKESGAEEIGCGIGEAGVDGETDD